MTEKELREANNIKEEINELESFILGAEKVWTGKIIKRDTTYIFKSNAYGAINSKEFKMNTEIKNKVLDVLREYLKNLKEKLEDM